MITVCLKLEKETKHTWRFKAEAESGKPPPDIETLYINKKAFNYGPAPKAITITIQEGEIGL